MIDCESRALNWPAILEGKRPKGLEFCLTVGAGTLWF